MDLSSVIKLDLLQKGLLKLMELITLRPSHLLHGLTQGNNIEFASLKRQSMALSKVLVHGLTSLATLLKTLDLYIPLPISQFLVCIEILDL
ncbi:hypothetical protein DsansV1_C06g0063291 [Dioscorea sansibarensis]